MNTQKTTPSGSRAKAAGSIVDADSASTSSESERMLNALVQQSLLSNWQLRRVVRLARIAVVALGLLTLLALLSLLAVLVF